MESLPLKPAPPESLDVPSQTALHDERLERLRVSANGRMLFTRWEAPKAGFDYHLVDLSSGRSIWNWKGDFGERMWEVKLSPDGSAALVLLPVDLLALDTRDPPFVIFPAVGKPIAMTQTEFTGGLWASGGGWFGGPSGAHNVDGTPRGPPVKEDWTNIESVLFMPGTKPGTLRYPDSGRVFEWDGQGPPHPIAPWRCSEQDSQHRMLPQDPPQFSPDGRFVAWVTEPAGRLTVCDGDSGQEFEVAPHPTPVAWVDERTLWRIDAGGLVGLDVLAHASTPRLALPGGAQAVALGASLQPPALFVGSAEGHLWRIPLCR